MEQQKDYELLAKTLVDVYFEKHNAGLLANLSKKNYEELTVTRNKIIEALRTDLSEYANPDGSELSDEQKDLVMELVRRQLWGYGIIDELIHDHTISDIKTYSAQKIRIKRKGKREVTNITFDSEEEYQTFVTRLLERNKVNLGTANAIQTFTDNTQDDFILRITAISGLLTDNGLPCIAFRKVPKDKYTLEYLKDAGMFGDTEPERLMKKIREIVNSKGVLFTGKGASGKTTLMNAMLAEIPKDESIMICQENAELFDLNHPDLLAAHVMVNGGDSKVSYTLGDLTRAALLVDLDRVIVGEVKEGSEAAGLSKASMTGHKCWTSVHGECCEMAVDKMADYISQATGYATKEALKQLCGFEYVIHLSRFKIDEIKRIEGWDRKSESLILSAVYPFEVIE